MKAMKEIKPLKKFHKIPKILSNLEKNLFSLKVQFELPSKQAETQDGLLVLSFGYIYLFNKANKSDHSYDCIDLLTSGQEFSYLDEKIKQIKIKTPNGQFYSIHSKSADLKNLYEYIFNVINILKTESEIIFNPPPPPINFSMQYMIYNRILYYVNCDVKNKKIPDVNKNEQSILLYFKDKKNYNQETIIINSNFSPDRFGLYISKAISTEPRIQKILFNNFNLSNNNLVECFINNSPNIIEFQFNGYNTAQPFNLSHAQKVVKQKFTFMNSYSSIFMGFLNSLQNSQIEIKNISISSLDMTSKDLVTFFKKMNQINSFKSLTSFSLSKTTFDDFPIDSFKEFITEHGEIESLSMSSIQIDGTQLFSAICDCEPLLYEIHLNDIVFSSQLKFDDKNDKSASLMMPCNLTLADFSHSRFIQDSLTPIIQFLTSFCVRKDFLSLNLSYLLPTTNQWVKAFKELNIAECKSNIIDIDWSGNNIHSLFFNFLSTQKKLKFISLMDIPPNDPSRTKSSNQTPTKLSTTVQSKEKSPNHNQAQTKSSNQTPTKSSTTVQSKEKSPDHNQAQTKLPNPTQVQAKSYLDFFFEHFYDIISKMPSVIGIDIGCNEFDKNSLIKFIDTCKNLVKIEHFYIKCQKGQNEVANSLSNLFRSLPKLMEVSVEMPELNPDSYIKLASSIIENKSILAAQMNDFIFNNKKKDPNQAKIESLINLIHSRKVPTTIDQRALMLISYLKKNQSNQDFNLGETINTICSNHQIYEENFEDNDDYAEVEIEEEEEDKDD